MPFHFAALNVHTHTNTLHVTHVFYVYTCIQYSITDTCAHRAANILLQAGPMVWNESELYVRVLLNNSWNILMRRLNNTSETNVILFLCKIPRHGQHLCTWIERENDVSNATEWLSLFRFIFPSRLCSLCYSATIALFVCRLQNNKCIANQLFIRCWIHIFYGQTLVAYRQVIALGRTKYNSHSAQWIHSNSATESTYSTICSPAWTVRWPSTISAVEIDATHLCFGDRERWRRK